MHLYWNKDVECMEKAALKKLQDERLVKTIRRVYENVPYYAAKMRERGLTPTTSKGSTTYISCPSPRNRTFGIIIPSAPSPPPSRRWCGCTPPQARRGSRRWWATPKTTIDLWSDCVARCLQNVGSRKTISSTWLSAMGFSPAPRPPLRRREAWATVVPASGAIPSASFS
jgi:phenylacetate-CoA ligase